MKTLRMIANMDLQLVRETYQKLPTQIKFKYFLIYMHINHKLCSVKDSDKFSNFCKSWDKNWDEINKMLTDPSAKQWTGIDLHKKEFDEKLKNQPEVLIDYYFKLLIFSNIKRLEKQTILTHPTQPLK